MRRYQNYRDIRRRALIYGLPVMFFVLQISAILGSLLVIIFSFGLTVIIFAVFLNLLLYYLLLKLSTGPKLYVRSVFPKMISNKRNTGLHYED